VNLSELRNHFRRMLAVARLELLHLVHDRTSISLILIVPAIQIVLFGYAVNLDPKHVPIAISRGNDAVVDLIHQIVRETGYFAIEADGLPQGGAKEMVADGKALVGIEIAPQNESDPNQLSTDPSVVVEASEPEAVRPALAALQNSYLRDVAETYAIGPVPEVKLDLLCNPSGKTAWTVVPGLVGVVVMITMLMLGALTLVRERERGSWETLMGQSTPSMRWWASSLLMSRRCGASRCGHLDRSIAI